MIIAKFYPNNICHTIYETGKAPDVLPDDAVEIFDYDYKYLRSYYDRENETWIFCPSHELIWDLKSKTFLLEAEIAELAKERATEE